jgi:hypothetical protein
MYFNRDAASPTHPSNRSKRPDPPAYQPRHCGGDRCHHLDGVICILESTSNRLVWLLALRNARNKSQLSTGLAAVQ